MITQTANNGVSSKFVQRVKTQIRRVVNLITTLEALSKYLRELLIFYDLEKSYKGLEIKCFGIIILGVYLTISIFFSIISI